MTETCIETEQKTVNGAGFVIPSVYHKSYPKLGKQPRNDVLWGLTSQVLVPHRLHLPRIPLYCFVDIFAKKRFVVFKAPLLFRHDFACNTMFLHFIICLIIKPGPVIIIKEKSQRKIHTEKVILLHFHVNCG